MTPTPTASAERQHITADLIAEEYLPYLADCDWTEGQKREFIEALWQIIVSFVDMGFGTHPLQQIPKALAADSSSVLALNSDSENSSIEDAKAGIRPRARRKDS